MVDFLFELGTEEIPARFMPKMLEELKTKTEKNLVENRLTFKTLETLGTDRRLVIKINGLLDKQPDLDREIKGPPAEIAFNGDALTPAGLGFCKKNNLDPATVQKKEIDGKVYLYTKQFSAGQATKALLPGLLQNVLASLYLPIAMRWGNCDTQFIRPIHWILALLGDEILPFSYTGINSSNVTYGHRLINPKAQMVTIATYAATLEKAGVYVDQNMRKDIVLAQLKQVEKEYDLQAIIPEELLWEVTYINECPKAVIAEIDEKYLSVPQECLIITMQKNQKYFPLLDKNGKLTKYFIVIANNVNDRSLPNIIKGNVKVVTARLEDAKFFYEEDKKQKLEHFLEGLKKVTYQEKIGTIYEKIERTVKIAGWLAGKTQADQKIVERLALVAKADLNSKMVYEFPELQGTMGMYYARVHGEPEVVAKGIADHWKPRFAGDDLTVVSKEAALVAIADKIDTIVGCYTVGMIPTSSSDPYALRRAAQGIVNHLYAQKIQLPLAEIVTFVLGLYAQADTAIAAQVTDFLLSRVEFVLKEMKIPHDVIKAIAGSVEVNTTIARAQAIARVKVDIQKTIAEPYTRLAKILGNKPATFDPGYITCASEYEQAVYTVAQSIEKKLIKATPELALNAFVELAAPITALFDNVLIEDDKAVQKKGLLSYVKALYEQIAIFSQLVY